MVNRSGCHSFLMNSMILARRSIAAGALDRRTGWNGLSRMKGNFQVRFLEGGGLATARFHSALASQDGKWCVLSGDENVSPICADFDENIILGNYR
jgi:hypothetical protein